MNGLASHKRVLRVATVILCLMAAISIAIGCVNAVDYPKGSFDFQYDSAKVFSLRMDPYDETMHPTEFQESLNLTKYYGSLQANQFPSMLMMLLPFTLLSPMTANWVWMLCNMLFSMGIVYLIKTLIFDECYDKWCQDNTLFVKKDGVLLYCFFVELLFIGTPWRNNIGNGQHTIMALFSFLLAVYFSKHNKEVLSGTALAISFFKYTLTVPLAIFFLHKKKYKALLVSMGIHVVLTVVAAIWLNASVIDMIIKPVKISSHLNAEGFLDIGAIFELGKVGMVITVLILLSTILYVLTGKYVGTDSELLSILIMLALVSTYHRPYDYFVLIIPVIVLSLKKQDFSLRIILWVVTLYTFFFIKGMKLIGISASLQQYVDYCIAFLLYLGVILSLVKAMKVRDITN